MLRKRRRKDSCMETLITDLFTERSYQRELPLIPEMDRDTFLAIINRAFLILNLSLGNEAQGIQNIKNAGKIQRNV